MKIYTCKFDGYYPVGACAVIVADNRTDALIMMMEKLIEMGLHKENEPIELVEVTQEEKQVIVLLDGDY